MRRNLILMAVVLLASQALVAADSESLDRRAGLRASATSWVKEARLSGPELKLAVDQVAASAASGPRPIVQIETNYYTFLPGEPVQVRITTHPNGFTAPVTLFLYQEDRVSGERRYYNVSGGLLAAGQSRDLFGSAGSPVPIVVPTLNDFVLFGSTSDLVGLSFGLPGVLGPSTPAPSQTGLFQWVLELRDAAGKRILSRSSAMYSFINESLNVSGSIVANTTWTANKRYVLNEFVGVTAPNTLTIEPGTVIYGGNPRATLFIQRGAKIIADGTVRRPIVFTSPQKVGSRAKQDWGSLVLLGNAPINDTRTGPGTAFLEGLPNTSEYLYGGTNPTESSGILRYVRTEFGGFAIAANQEINGLTLAGVGNGTVVDYVEVLHNRDDAFEFFGGTVNAKHLLAVAADDDGLDYDLGYQGDIQFAAIIRRAVNDQDEPDGNLLIEADGHPATFTLTPLSNPRIYNVTGYGSGRTDVGNYGAVLRRGTAGKIFNAIITGVRRAPVTIRDDATFALSTSGELIINNSIFNGSFADAAFANSADRAASTRTFVLTTMGANRNIDPLLVAGAPSQIKTLLPDLTPLPNSPALDIDLVAAPPDNSFFEPVDFIGAVGPGDNWILSGWANFSDN